VLKICGTEFLKVELLKKGAKF
jgi:hypothetical protein